MTTTFTDALKRREQALNAKLTGKPEISSDDKHSMLGASRLSAITSTAKPQDPIEVRVRLMLAVKEIEVHFNRYPGDGVISDLKAAGFSWSGTCWFAPDSEQKRAFCRTRFNATELEAYDVPPPDLIVAPDPDIQSDCQTPGDWNIYCQQVDELLAYFRTIQADYCAGDLQLAAISHYHKHIFARN